MKTREELNEIMERLACADSPVGMDAVYVHAVIIDKLERIERRLDALEGEKGKSEKIG